MEELLGTFEYANVIIDISHEKVDKPFQYRIPERLKGRVEVGTPVEVPFGRGNTLRKAFVIEMTDKPDWEPDKIKEIAGIREDAVSHHFISPESY